LNCSRILEHLHTSVFSALQENDNIQPVTVRSTLCRTHCRDTLLNLACAMARATKNPHTVSAGTRPRWEFFAWISRASWLVSSRSPGVKLAFNLGLSVLDCVMIS